MLSLFIPATAKYAYPVYGVPSKETVAAIRLSARLAGRITDPVYEGKSMQGMIDLVQKGFFPKGSLAVAVQRDRAANWLFALSSFQPPDDLARQSVGPARRALRQGIARTTEVAALLMFRARRQPGRA